MVGTAQSYEVENAMRIGILRREPGISFSMDIYADGLVRGLKTVRPTWNIIEMQPQSTPRGQGNVWLRGGQKYYRRYWQHPRRARSQAVDLFHITDHSDGHLAYWLAGTGKPVVVTCHDLINFLQPENISDQARVSAVSTAIWQYSVKGIRKADHIVTVSDYTAKDAMRLLHIPASHLTTVPNGFDAEFTRFSAEQVQSIREYYHLSPDCFCLLHVGSNQPRKNVFTVLKVLAALCAQGLPVQFLKAGGDFNQEQRDFIAAHNLTSVVRYLGKPDTATLAQLYNAADVLLSPSLYEGFGITFLEAMACGTPVITSNVTSLPEVVGDAGILVNPTDVDAMVQAVQRLMQETSYRKLLIERGLSRVQAFSWERTAEQVAQIYEKILDSSLSAP